MIFYRFPKTSFLGKVTKIHAEIDKDVTEISFKVTFNAFIPANVIERFSDPKVYRSYLNAKFFNNKWFKQQLRHKLPAGYYIDPNKCFEWSNDGLDVIRQFDKMYSSISVYIRVCISNETQNVIGKYPERHCNAILEVFNQMDKLFENIQTTSGYLIIFNPFNIAKMRNSNKSIYLNNVAQNYKYLLKEIDDE